MYFINVFPARWDITECWKMGRKQRLSGSFWGIFLIRQHVQTYFPPIISFHLPASMKADV